MKLVIDIDEYYYRTIKSVVDRGIFNAEPWTNIANGTPLPKGHGRLIDADAVLNVIEDDARSGLYSCFTSYDDAQCLKASVRDLPTIIEADKEEN